MMAAPKRPAPAEPGTAPVKASERPELLNDLEHARSILAGWANRLAANRRNAAIDDVIRAIDSAERGAAEAVSLTAETFSLPRPERR